MSSVAIQGNASGTGVITLASPNTNSSYTVSLPAATGTIAVYPEIQPISASVAASALTISASSLTLDFRSTALGSGAVTTVSGTPANLVVPSSATLGTVSAVQSRLVVIALNNAGTIELAVVNIAGGTNLTETTLLTTTAISAGATSASTVYSTSARTSVAYRVIGYIESTQATAGTWATSPSTIQGQGGQALADMSSLGYGQTWQSFTGSRALSTTYYNTTGKPIVVRMLFSQGSTGGFSATPTVGGVALPANSWYGVTGQYGGLDFLVPVGQSYSVVAASSTIVSWSELR